MTHIDDIKRAKGNDHKEYLHYRIDALEKRVEFLEKSLAFKEAQLEVAKQIIK
jgi:hypothetical protein